jgi:hypothetical protein
LEIYQRTQIQFHSTLLLILSNMYDLYEFFKSMITNCLFFFFVVAMSLNLSLNPSRIKTTTKNSSIKKEVFKFYG